MSKAISIRVQPLTGRKAAGQRRHDLRYGDRMPDYINQEKTKDNSVILETPDVTTLRKEIEKNRKKAHQQKLRADSRTVISGIITFGRQAQSIINELSTEKQDALYKKIAMRIEKETGHRLIGLVVHRDESAPHAHFSLRGYRLDEDGKEQSWRKTPQEMSRLQDKVAEEVLELGIERGKKKTQRIKDGDDPSTIVNRGVKKLHEDLPREIEELNNKIAEQKRKQQKNERLIIEQQKKLAEQKTTIEKYQKLIKTYEKRAADAQENIKLLLQNNKRLVDIAERLRITQPLPEEPLSTAEKLELLRNSNNNQEVMSR